jgi:hypothetical protein
MLEGRANGGHGGINLLARCAYEPSICFGNFTDFVRTCIKVDGGEHGVN